MKTTSSPGAMPGSDVQAGTRDAPRGPDGKGANAPLSTTPLILELRQVGRDDLGLAGGKGANLGELVRGGFPVPPGFVVSTAAYDRFVTEHHLDETIAHLLRREPSDGAAIRAAFEAAPIPPAVERDILAAYAQLGQGPVAVRSSATAEDLPQAAFAGQQDTYLNVVGPVALLDAVRRCWASLWTDRAIAYRARLDLDQGTVKIAVVVQRMVEAEAAGVMFTANPVTGARHEIVVTASPGLGEAVVAGLVTPDQYVLRRGRWGWRVTERRLGQREVIIRSRPDGGTEQVTGTATRTPALSDRALRRLARLGAAIERRFGAPQDVEWAESGGELFIVQARPITALPAPPPRTSRPVQMMAGLIAELFPSRPYPLEATTWGFEYVFSTLLGSMFRALGLAIRTRGVFLERDGVVSHFTGRMPLRLTPAVLLAPLRLRRLARRYDPARWQQDPLLAELLAGVRALEARDLSALSWSGLLRTVQDSLALPALVGKLRVRYLIPRVLAIAKLRLLLGLLGAGDRFDTLIATGVETKTLETNRALEALASRIRSDPVLAETFADHDPEALWGALEARPEGRRFLEELRAFLDAYGHREVGGIMRVSAPTWKDAPAMVLGLLQGLARSQSRPQPPRPAWEAARDKLLTHPLLRLPPLRRAFLRLLEEARWFTAIREDTHFYATMALPVLRRTLLELGRRLVDTGVLATPGDIFHLKLAELERLDGRPSPRVAAELADLVTQRKATRAALADTPLIDPRLFARPVVDGDALLRGVPGSPGVAEGPVRIIRDGSGFGTLRAGDVLVAPYTNPAWTPLFERAAAVVVDSGGAGSHAAIVAREYGIPAVMATVDATRRLVDGQRVRVDGARGLVLDADQAASHITD